MKYLFWFIFFPSCAWSQANHAVLIDSFMKAQVEVKNFNGNVLVAKSGEVVFEGSYGYRNFDTKEMLDNRSVFELASVSKQFTAMGILLLNKDGKLQLSDTLRKFFPELPYYNISIRQLLNHTSGLPDYMNTMDLLWDRKKIAYNKDIIQYLATYKPPVYFPPGSKFEYSNTGYALLASVIEKVSQKSFGDFLKENIFIPLEMYDTRVYNRRAKPESVPNYAYGYVYSRKLKKYVLPDSIPQLSMVYFLDGIQGDGTVNSTTTDLLKWDRALKHSILLPQSMQKEMLSIQSVVDSTKKTGYGYGVIVGKNKFGQTISHSGGWPGYYTRMQRNADDDITIIVLSNNESDASVLTVQLDHILHGVDVGFPYTPVEVKISPSLFDRYVGKYRGENEIELTRENDKFYISGSKKVELKAESETKFFFADGSDRQVEFLLNDKNEVIQAWMIINGIRSDITNKNSR